MKMLGDVIAQAALAKELRECNGRSLTQRERRENIVTAARDLRNQLHDYRSWSNAHWWDPQPIANTQIAFVIDVLLHFLGTLGAEPSTLVRKHIS
jgi:hypothetical protein